LEKNQLSQAIYQSSGDRKFITKLLSQNGGEEYQNTPYRR
jgi:hypothetical protein